ncbi:MAG: Type 1 glutamine amidotransferase-like domain-containing protein [Thermomicrobiales bacterium]|nr:Type 1 glutamine amidotransferase-like domain-containing protein [Thermomicrobiales bacterium]MCO5219596.1 Type 1 glutamine amidotransferase-like domain-containing protein [Thermomicrobiales bacterium]MCO5226366.1 Type 1 glutamine amidotransferase-like domain-containing protein [Thermomicrobiales bacterium]
MKMLLTSGGITNASIRQALSDLLGKPIAECNALAIPTATYAHPMAGPKIVYQFIAGTPNPSMVSLGWRSVGVLELTALPSLGEHLWRPWVEDADVLLVDGGDALFLAHWMRESGLAELLPSLNIVWVGVSAGSMVMTPRIGAEFVQWASPNGRDETLGLVDFCIFPHLEYPGWEGNTLAAAEKWAAEIGHPSYAIDEQTAIVVDGDRVEIISEGLWVHKTCEPHSGSAESTD